MKLKKIGIMTIGSMVMVAMPVFAISCGGGSSSGSGWGQNPEGTNPLDDPNYDASNVADVKVRLDQDEDLIKAVRDTYYVEDHQPEFLVQPGTPQYIHSISGQYDALLSRMQPLVNNLQPIEYRGTTSFDNGSALIYKQIPSSFISTIKPLDFLEYKENIRRNEYSLKTTWGEIDTIDPNIKSLNTHAANVHFVFKDGKWQARYQLLPFGASTADHKYLFWARLPFGHSITDARRAELDRTPGGTSFPDYYQFTHNYFDKYMPLKSAFPSETFYFIDPEFPLYDPTINPSLEGQLNHVNASDVPKILHNFEVSKQMYEASWDYVPLDEVDSTSELGIAWQATKVKYGI